MDIAANEGGWPTATYNSATCRGQIANWGDELMCEFATETAANATLVADFSQLEAAAVQGGDTTMSITVEADGSVKITHLIVSWLKMFPSKSKFNQQIALDIYDEIVSRMLSA